ncbi:hypothetical protein [Streptacidiphilus fuscans]|uniref:Uncharacterized protein n=1 Tax=Streptacidiphilus fuscans TaxID=2789292 RepID=A0A931BF49_9ACTN|nr:hypothetical protein [Streptacidiphilus fuscans]MBF9072315.1 hypothetical protein [Streptacidiphilus fuscans]
MTNTTGPAAPTQRESSHETSVTEKGAFAVAQCSCGWYAPARRSRDKARRDADQHEADA